jgi:pSer/pThr/pTyr-binding forkhead associated (FHA) protein/tetratricopeptide (TPR) repeat protein
VRIEIFRQGQLLQEMNLQDQEVWMGRDDSCKIRLDDRSVSRKHAVLRSIKGGMEVQKVSEFGVMKLNGQNADHSPLKAGDRIEVGPFEIRLMQEAVTPVEKPVEMVEVASNIEQNIPVEAQPVDQQPDPMVSLEPEAQTPEVNEVDPFALASDQQDGFAPDSVPSDGGVFAEGGMVDPATGDSGSASASDFGVETDDRTRFIRKEETVRAILDFGGGNEFEIGDEEVAIGRSQQCHVVLEDRRASRKNTLIRKQDGRYVIKDLSSANGTYLNNEKIDEAELHGGDEIKVGDTTFRFQVVQSDYEIRKQDFISVPQPEIQMAPPELMPSMQSLQSPFAQPQLNPNPFANPQPTYQEPTFQQEPEKKPSLIGGLLDRYRMMDTRRQIIWGIAVLAVVWMMLEEDEDPKKVKLNTGVPKKTAVQKKNQKKTEGGATFEMLTPEQRKYVETQYQFAFDLYKNREYDRCLLELDKVFSLVSDYNNAREIAAFAREGKRKLEAIEEERKRKEQERQAQLKLQSLLEQVGHLMTAKKYKEAEALFPEIELIQPENFAVSEWRKQIITETERAAREAEEKRKLEEFRATAWRDFSTIKPMYDQKLHYEALDKLDELLTRNVDVEKFNEQVKEEIRKNEAAIDAARDPVVAAARQFEKDGKLTEAYREYQKVTKIDPMDEEAPEGMKRIKNVLAERAKHIYTEGVFAESFGDMETAEKKYREVMEVVPKGDGYYNKAESKLRKLTVLKKSVTEGTIE